MSLHSDIVKILNDEGAASEGGWHSWRCFDKDRYPEPCECTEVVASMVISAALDAAREAIAEQKLVPLAKQGRFIITRNTQLWKQRQAWSELGWWDFRTSALAAIDALKETNAASK